MRQRGIPTDVVDLIVLLGTPRRRSGRAVEYIVRHTDRQAIIGHLKQLIQKVDRLGDKGVLISDDDEVITMYHLTK